MPIKVLIVEDDVATLELMKEVLSSLKVEVYPLHDSTEAAVLANRERYLRCTCTEIRSMRGFIGHSIYFEAQLA